MAFTTHEKHKIRAELAGRYRNATKAEKSKIRDEYLALKGGGNRKYAVTARNRVGEKQLRRIDGNYVNVSITTTVRKKRVYTKYYDDEAANVLIRLWKFFNIICGERLAPLLRRILTP